MEAELIELDGTQGEGGGQILRTALFLSLVTGRGFRVTGIRAGRSAPGLKRQHLGILRALAKISTCEVEGASLGSPEVAFRPGPITGGGLEIDLQSAGAIPLFLQTLLPVALHAQRATTLAVKGGTDVPFSPTIDWVVATVVPLLRPLATSLRLQTDRRGFHPAGGGKVCVAVKPGDVLARERGPLRLARSGPVIEVGGSSVASAALRGPRVAERQRQAAARVIREAMGRDPEIRCEYADSLSIGTSITLWIRFEGGGVLGADALGRRGLPAESVGETAARALVAEWRAGAAVDRHLADHLIPWLGLLGGDLLTSEITSHAVTNALVTERFLGVAIEVRGREIRCSRP